MFEHIQQDWTAHDRSWSRHGFWALVVYRFGRWRYSISFRPARMPLSIAYKVLKFISQMFFGVELPCEAIIGERLVIEHTGAIVISGDAIFGNDCILRQGVTVGLRHRGVRGSPRIGDRVDIGAGAKLLGPIRIGSDVAIGANAVVLCDVPDHSIAIGVPARIRPRATKAAHGPEIPVETPR